MAELFTFSEDGMRKLVEMYRAQQREMHTLKRNLAHYSTRRHQTVYMPGSECKIVRPNTNIHAAWGGPSALYDTSTSGGLVESYGNYVAGVTNVKRQMYSAACSVYEYDSEYDLADTGDDITCYNPGALPCYSRATYLAVPFGGDYLITTPLDQFGHHKTQVNIVHSVGGTQTIKFGEHKFLNATLKSVSTGNFGTTSGDSTGTVYAPGSGSDVFIRLPGAYKVTFGIQLSYSGNAEKYTATDSSGHTTEFWHDTIIRMYLWKNFDPDTGNVVAQATGAETGPRVAICDTTMPMGGSVSAVSPAGSVMMERTVEVIGTLADWHGGPYTRLSISLAVTKRTGATATNALEWSKAWMVIEPMSNGRQSSAYDGVGMNPFLGTSGAYQWYGGGPAPAYFDADGVWI